MAQKQLEMRESGMDAGGFRVLKVKQGKKGEVKAQLLQKSLWKEFDAHQNEMLLTRVGRRMFPVPEFSLEGLDPKSYYSCELRLVSGDRYRYKYDTRSEVWKATTIKADFESLPSYVHPLGVILGKVWMNLRVMFNKMKLTNRLHPGNDKITLSTLHKYKLQLIVNKLSSQCERWVFDFPETEFIAVTCYQNPAITALKIQNNPYAKAFRKNSFEVETKDEDESSSRPDKKQRLMTSSSGESSAQSSYVHAKPPKESAKALALAWTSSSIDVGTPSDKVEQQRVLSLVSTKRLHHYSVYQQRSCCGDELTDSLGCYNSDEPEPTYRYIPVMGDPFSYQHSTPVTSYTMPINGRFRVEISGVFGNNEAANHSRDVPELTNQMPSWPSTPSSFEVTNQDPFLSNPAHLASANQMLQWSPMSVTHEQDSANHSASWSMTYSPESANHSFSSSMTSFYPELLGDRKLCSWKSMSMRASADGYDTCIRRSYTSFDGSFLREN